MNSDLQPLSLTVLSQPRQFWYERRILGVLPRALSPWWVPILLGFGWGPLFMDDLACRLDPHLDVGLGAASAFAMAWGLDVTIAATLLASISLFVQIFRAVTWAVRSKS